MAANDLDCATAELRKQLVLAISLYWIETPQPREILCCFLDDVLTLPVGATLTEHGLGLFDNARKKWPMFYQENNICWNCGSHYPRTEAPTIMPYCSNCDAQELMRPALWQLQSMLRGYLCNRITRMQADCLILEGVAKAIAPTNTNKIEVA